MKILKTMLLWAAIVLHACTSSKPIYYAAGAPDYNTRKSVSRPQFKSRINPIGM